MAKNPEPPANPEALPEGTTVSGEPPAEPGAPGSPFATAEPAPAAAPAPTSAEDIAEYKRQLEAEKAERAKVQRELEQFREAFNAVRDFGKAPGGAPEPQDEDIDDTLMYTDPKAYREKVSRRITEQVRREVQRDMQNSQVREELLHEFPELADNSTEFFKEVDRAYSQQLQRFNLPPKTVDFNLIRLTAESVDRQRVRRQLSEGVVSDSRPSDAPGSSVRPTSRRPAVQLSEAQKGLARELGISEKDYADLIGKESN